MSAGTLKKLVAALVVVFVLWGGVSLASRRGGAQPPDGAIAQVLEGLTPASVQAVHMTRPGDTVALAHDGSRWTVNGWAADSAAVAGLFSTIGETRIGDLVASNPANHARMGVAEDSTWTVTFDTDGGARTLLVGGAGPRYGTAYVRMPGEDGVYLLEGDLRARMDRSVDDWRNKRVTRVDTAAVHRVEVGRKNGAYALVRADSTWNVEGGAAADATAVKNLLSELADMRADAFLSVDDSVAGLPEATTVTALGTSGDTLAALRVGAGATNRWARARGDSVLYRVGGWRVDRVAPAKDAVSGGSE